MVSVVGVEAVEGEGVADAAEAVPSVHSMSALRK